MTRICDYEGSQYRTDFWEGQNRLYEDRVERLALRKLLPPQGTHLIEVGAGFGRLADLYDGYEHVVLMDYARTQLEQARDYVGNDERFTFVVADVYHMPFADNLFDALAMVRVMHHLADVPAALAELHRIIAPEGVAIIEHASKFHLKSLARWLLRRQEWSPFDREPVEFVELNFDFHPAWMRHRLERAGFQIKHIRTVSHYRLNVLKRVIPTSWLVTLDSLAQPSGKWFQLSPSIFLQAQVQKSFGPSPETFFRCPVCRAPIVTGTNLPPQFPDTAVLTCQSGQHHWSVEHGIYDFKTPVKAT